jgi:hypothetical protein
VLPPVPEVVPPVPEVVPPVPEPPLPEVVPPVPEVVPPVPEPPLPEVVPPVPEPPLPGLLPPEPPEVVYDVHATGIVASEAVARDTSNRRVALIWAPPYMRTEPDCPPMATAFRPRVTDRILRTLS